MITVVTSPEPTEAMAFRKACRLLYVVAVLLAVAAVGLGATEGKYGITLPIGIAGLAVVISLGYVVTALSLLRRDP